MWGESSVTGTPSTLLSGVDTDEGIPSERTAVFGDEAKKG